MLYLDIKIDKEGVLRELKELYVKSLAFAVEIEYFSKDTIKFIIGKAARNEKAIENLLSSHKNKSREEN